MARDPRYDILFEPIRIGPKQMKNRFYATPHSTNLGSDFPGATAYLRGTRAEGGWAVVNTGFCSIHPEFDPRPYVDYRIWDDDDVRNLSLMVDKVHSYESLIGCELYFGGAMGSNLDTRIPTRGISQIPSEQAWFHSCYEMSKRDIRELQGFYVAAAKRARSAGFDVINIAGGEVDAVPIHFLMRFFNKRTDEYGGSLENRARFWRETIEQVKEEVGDDCAIAVRFGVDTLDGTDKGIRVEEEGVGFIELCDHLVDLWDLVVGGYYSHGLGVAKWGTDTASSRFYSENWQAKWISKVRPYTKKPIVGVGWLTNPDTMIEMINTGQVDIVGSARGQIADPFLPKKIEEGRNDEIRECIGSNICISAILQGNRIACTQNATMGEEYRRGWHPEQFSKAANADNDVLIVGAGPAGLECAAILGKRGMRRIHLVDSQKDMGGALRWMTKLPRLGPWNRIVDYRRIQIDKLSNVEFVPATSLNAENVLHYGAEFVIVATGAHWARNGLNGPSHDTIPGADADEPYCLTPEQIMVEGKEVPGKRVLIYDTEGYFMGSALAEKLALGGYEVSYVTPFASVSPFCYLTEEGAAIFHTLEDIKVEIITGQLVTEVYPDQVKFARVDRMDEQSAHRTDAIVLVTQRLSNDALYHELHADEDLLANEGIKGVYRIGDCIVPRLIADCIFDGHRLAREIDSPDPANALPFIREHRILGLDDKGYDERITTHAGADQRPTSIQS